MLFHRHRDNLLGICNSFGRNEMTPRRHPPPRRHDPPPRKRCPFFHLLENLILGTCRCWKWKSCWTCAAWKIPSFARCFVPICNLSWPVDQSQHFGEHLSTFSQISTSSSNGSPASSSISRANRCHSRRSSTRIPDAPGDLPNFSFFNAATTSPSSGG